MINKLNNKKDIKSVAKSSDSISIFAKKYINYLTDRFSSIDFSKLEKLKNFILKARNAKKTIFVFGNGGSAATASTMANDLGFDILKKTSTDKPFKFFALTDNTPVITAIANDTGYENLLINQLKIHFTKGDVVILISASGNSKNLLIAAKWIRKNGGSIFSLLGFDGGKLKKLSNEYILVKSPEGDYGPVEDAHLIINHILAHWFQNKL